MIFKSTLSSLSKLRNDLDSLQGEEQKKLDVLSNEVFVKALVSSGRTVSKIFVSPSIIKYLQRLRYFFIFNS